ncbi:MAG: hypothetical protein JST68_00920, partial [Bacteroidetes bacterium]|nr:hypothetical protein [Bacteroidota bacterium]
MTLTFSKTLVLSLFICLATPQLFAQTWGVNGTSYYYTGGNVGIGTQTPSNRLEVRTDGANANDRLALNLVNPSTAAFASVQLNLTAGTTGTQIVSQRDNTSNGAALYITSPDLSGIAQPRMAIAAGGNVGIGVVNPGWKLDVRTFGNAGSDQYCMNLQNPSTAAYAAVELDMRLGDGTIASSIYAQRDNLTKASTTSFFNTDAGGTSKINMQIFGNGTVGIGSPTGSFPNLSYKLDVAGTAHATKVVVTAGGADYVFDSTYRLAPLAEVADSIRSNHHLPGIASASQMQKEGVDLGDNQTRLLAKIEELTLYMLQQNERMNNFSQQVESLKAQNAALQQEIKMLRHDNTQKRRNSD